MIQIQSFQFNAFGENTYVLYDETKDAVVIDPGCYEASEREELDTFIENNGLNIKKLLNTHCHIDHVLGNLHVSHKYGVDLWIHELDLPLLSGVKIRAQQFGFPMYQEKDADQFFKEGDIISFGNSNLEVIFTPGHAPGHVVFLNKKENICIGGDVLFKQSIGRTDLPGGNHEELLSSIRNKLFVLDDNMTVYPGHGPTTTIGYEKVHNPFLK